MPCTPVTILRPETASPSLFPASDPDTLDERAWLACLIDRAGAVCGRTAAARLLDRFGGLAAVVAADADELAKASGLGPEAIADLKLMRRLAVLLVRSDIAPRPIISSWASLLAYVRVALSEEPREQFRALFLDRRNGLIRDEMQCTGTVDHAPVYPREVVRRALELSASALILVHNHPSGDPAPSSADIEMTRKIVQAARLFSIEVHDHLIVARSGTASLKSLGLM